MKRIYRLYFTASCLSLLMSCSTIDLAYNNAPWYVASELDDAFDLTDRQSSQLDLLLQQFFAWHREQELARYQQLLEDFAIAAADGISAAEFLALNHDIRLAWRRSLEKAIDNFGDIAQTLSPTQIENYQRYHAENSAENQEYLEKTEAQREKYRLERHLDRLEKWFGNFDRKLEQKVSARLKQLPDIRESWFRFRDKRHQAMLSALNRASQSGISSQELKRILLDPSTEYARTFEPGQRAYWQAYAVVLEDINTWLTEKHRRKVVSKLEEYARAFARLQVKS